VEEPPATIEFVDGRCQSDTLLAWHEVPVDIVYLDEAYEEPFTGTIHTETQIARLEGGSDVELLWGDAVENGAPLTMLAFEKGLSKVAPGGDKIVLLCVILFGVSTAISWSYYGDRCANYVLGPSAILPYRGVFVLMHFLGAVLPLSVAWKMGDVLMGIVILPNLIALILLSPKVAEEARGYFGRKPWKKR
jgi:AGCS family alanine or glycine:cation symporter